LIMKLCDQQIKSRRHLIGRDKKLKTFSELEH
jgi:tetrahydromethanopterin S-methyltransferase subunit F